MAIHNEMEGHFQLKRRLIFVLLLFFAVLIYLPGIWWGLPHASHPEFIHGWDVDGVAGVATLAEFHNLLIEPKPDWYVAYPLFHYVLDGAISFPYLAYLFFTGQLSNPTSTYPYGFQNPIEAIAILTFLGRIVTLLMAIGVVLGVFETVQTIWNQHTGIVAAIVVGLLHPVLYYSRTSNLDIPVLFWIVSGLWLVAQICADGYTMRRGIGLGAVVALAAATKDQTIGVWLPGLIALWIYLYLSARKKGEQFDWKSPIMTILAGILVYSLASGLLISPRRYIAHINFLLNFQNTFYNVSALDLLVPKTPEGYFELSIDFLNSLLMAQGAVILLFSILGILGAWKESIFVKILSFMIVGYILLVIVPIRHMQYRYIIFPATGLSIFAARALFFHWNGNRYFQWFFRFAFMIGIGWLLLKAIDLSYQMIVDTRYEAQEWLYEQLQAKDKVAYFGASDQLPGIPSGVTIDRLPDDNTANEILMGGDYDYVLVLPDWSSEAGMLRSRFMDENVYRCLESGELPYRPEIRFNPKSILSRPLKYLAFINPPICIYTHLNSNR